MICQQCGYPLTHADILADCGCCLLCLWGWALDGADAAYDEAQHELHFGPWDDYTGECETSRSNLGLGRVDDRVGRFG
jgi:hypothetical protein